MGFRPAGLMVSLRLLAAIVIFRYCSGYSDDRAGGGSAAGQRMAAKTRADRLAVLSGAEGDEPGDAPGVVDEPPRLAAGCPDGRVELAANLVSAVVTQYETLLAARFIASLAGGTLICASVARLNA